MTRFGRLQCVVSGVALAAGLGHPALAQVSVNCTQISTTTWCNGYDYGAQNQELQNSMGQFGAALGEAIRERRERRAAAKTSAVAQEAYEEASARNEVDRFALDPAHPYFGLVRPQMSELLNSGQATTLQQAYDIAVASSPAAQAAQAALAKAR